MIKIEKLTNGCSAFLKNGKELIKGQLVNNSELEGIEVLNGTLTVSIDELEVRELHSAKTPEIIEKPQAEILKELDDILIETNTKIDSVKTPQKIDSVKSPQKIDSAKSPQKIDSAKSPQK